MKQIWKTILLFIIGYHLVGCVTDPQSVEDKNVSFIPLQSGLWLPEAPLITDTTLVADTTIISTM